MHNVHSRHANMTLKELIALHIFDSTEENEKKNVTKPQHAQNTNSI